MLTSRTLPAPYVSSQAVLESHLGVRGVSPPLIMEGGWCTPQKNRGVGDLLRKETGSF